MTLRAVIPYAPKEKTTGSEADTVDRAGNAILEFIKHAEETTKTDLQRAAEYLADQLRAALDQINDLKADVRRHQARADRAEKWLRQIFSEIERRSLGANDGRSARGLGFLRMSG
jgi:hypothetical protein